MKVSVVSITVKDEKLRQIKLRVAELSRLSATVGWHANGPRHIYRTRGGELRTSHQSVAEVASAHEYGVPAIDLPARPIHGATIAHHSKELGRVAATLLRELYRAPQTGGEGVLRKLGAFWEGRTRGIFDAQPSEWPVLSTQTVTRKTRSGSPYPNSALLDTRHLQDTITSRVSTGGYR